MFNLPKLMFIVMGAFFFTSALMAESDSNFQILVKGGGTFVSPNALSNGFNSNVTKLVIKARENRIKKGIFRVSSTAAGPIDPITGVDFELKARIDAARVFADHPDVVWVHGFTKTGFITFGTDPGYGPLAGTTTPLNAVNGELIGAVTTWGRTNFLTVFENGNVPLPNFFTATEGEFTALVGGFSRILLTTGAKPGKLRVETTGETITIP
jgi:hypothetical protein